MLQVRYKLLHGFLVYSLLGGGILSAFESGYHKPVMLEEVLRFLNVEPGKLICDGTLGGGGHSEAILQAGGEVLALDCDEDALDFANKRLEDYGKAFRAVRGNFADMEGILEKSSIKEVDGVLLDFGVSSYQLDTGERGFSFMQDGPLDMRMGKGEALSAIDVINNYEEGDLVRIFRAYGEERRARRVAQAIIRQRERGKISRTLELAELVEEELGRTSGKHPATKVFQALRMEVNGELAAIERALVSLPKLLRPGGRVVFITFHSLEDRLVKHFLRRTGAAEVDRPEWPAPRANEEYYFKVLTRKPVYAGEEELKLNPRARSAKLRAAERIIR